MRKTNILSEYDRIGVQIKKLEARRLEIREQVEAKGGQLYADDWVGLLQTQSREQLAGIEACSKALGRATLDKHGLIKTITYQKLVVARAGRSRKAS